MSVMENSWRNNKTRYVLIAFVLLLFSNLAVAKTFPINFSDVSNPASAKSTTATAKITVLITLEKAPLIRAHQQMRKAYKAYSSDTKQRRQVRSQLVDQKQRLVAKQINLLQIMTARQIPFVVKRRLQVVTNTIVLEIDAGSLDEIKTLPGVKAVHKEKKYRTSLDNSVSQVRAPETWQLSDANLQSVDGRGIRVAIIDTGVDYNHPDLGGGMGPEFKVIGGWDFANNDHDPMDEIGHGTHVAGIVAADGELRGVAPAAKLLVYNVFHPTGDAFESDILAAMEKAVDPDGDPLTDDGAHVINMSLGGPGGSESPLSHAANAAMEAGVVVVVSAGNSGGFYNVGSPGTAESVITVAATDNGEDLAQFSSGGPVMGLAATKPEISAPGVAIRSTVLDGEYNAYDGTSMAAPHVAGAAALLRQLHPDLSSAQLKHLLISSATHKPGNLYREGVAALDILAATEKALIITPSQINLGEVGGSERLWQKTASFTLRNLSSERRDFQLSSNASVMTGVTLELLSVTKVTLAAGEAETVNYRLEVDNSKLAVSPDWPANFELEITIADEEFVWQLPVTFHKSHLLSINADSPLTFSMFHSDDGSWSGSYPVDKLGSFVPVKAGSYKVFSLFQDEIVTQNINARPMIINEAIELTSTEKVTVNLSPTEVSSVIGLHSFVDTSGETIPLDESNSLGFDIKYHLLDTESEKGFGFDEVKNLAVNAVESPIRLSAKGFVALQDDARVNVMTFKDSWFIGAENHPIELDLATMETGHITVNVAPGEPATIALRHWNNQDLFAPFASYWHNPVNQFEAQNFDSINLFGHADVEFEDSGVFETGLELSLVKPGSEQPVSTQSFSFTPEGLTKFDFAFSDERDSWVTTPTLDGDELSFSGSSLFWSARTQVVFQPGKTFLLVGKPRTERMLFGLIPVAPIQDSWLNDYQQAMPYTVHCDLVELNRGELAESFDHDLNAYTLEASRDCDRLKLQVFYNNQLEGIEYQSSMESLLNSSRGESTLALERVSILSAGEPATSISGDEGQVIVELAQTIVSSVTEVTLEIKVDQGEWIPLITEQHGNTFEATIAAPTKLPEAASLRIIVENNLDNILTNTINGAFVYGTRDPMQLDSDDDLVVDEIDAFPNDPSESVDTDKDGIGNNADRDDDGDRMPDSFEILYQLKPLDPSDATGDLDNDGLTNLAEFTLGRNPRGAQHQGGGSMGFLLFILFSACCRHFLGRAQLLNTNNS